MSDIDKSLIGSVINALPLDKMIAGPLNAMVTSQVQASRSYVDFLTSVCIKDGKAVSVNFSYEETLVDDSGRPVKDESGNVQTLKKHINVPLLAVVSHPNITLEEGTIDFELEVSQSAQERSSTDMEAETQASLGWGPFKVSIKGRVSHKSEQTRKTDTRAKYSIHTRIARQGPPEALQRVIDFITDANTKPITGAPVQAGVENQKDQSGTTDSQ